MSGEHPAWVASGRTDSGVHASGQVAHFSLENPKWEPYKLLRGMNTLLPPSIRLLEVAKVSDTFHAQIGALKKQYSYYFLTGTAPIAHLSRFATYTHLSLDVTRMNEALQMILGEHDFIALQGRGATVSSTIRTLFEAEVVSGKQFFPFTPPTKNFELIQIRLVGSGFLKHMVRSIAGTLLEIGEGRREVQNLYQTIHSKDRLAIGPTAAPQGLWLERVWYAESPFHKS
jgi:tRNA pseudouridine38-40 synthase